MQKSVAYNHFPKVVVQENRFWLYNPILKKRFKNRPEERVRLQWVEYLLHQTNCKRSRIGFETPVKLRERKNTLRADIVLYSDEMKPETLIECKSETVKLNEAAAVQAARYNKQIDAKNLVLTNGIQDFWFAKTDNTIRERSNIFDEITKFQNLERDLNYWSERGFCSKDLKPKIKEWLVKTLIHFWSGQAIENRRYLDFKQTLLPVPMNQYYRLFDVDSEKKVAVSFLGTPTSDAWLIGILNEHGKNRGVAAINLSKIEAGREKAVLLFQNGERKGSTSNKLLSDVLTRTVPLDAEGLAQVSIKVLE